MTYNRETLSVYNRFSEYFDEKFGEYTDKIIKEELREIAQLFPRGAKMLDIGSGPGNHALFFKQQEFDVLCLDNSDAMLNKCREKGLATVKMDFENMQFPKQSFDIVLAYTSLLHIPKSHLQHVLISIHNIIKDNGFFVLSLKEGEGEGFVTFSQGGRRWFSYYSNDEIRAKLSPHFDIVRNWRVSVSDKVFLDYLCKKKR